MGERRATWRRVRGRLHGLIGVQGMGRGMGCARGAWYGRCDGAYGIPWRHARWRRPPCVAESLWCAFICGHWQAVRHKAMPAIWSCSLREDDSLPAHGHLDSLKGTDGLKHQPQPQPLERSGRRGSGMRLHAARGSCSSQLIEPAVQSGSGIRLNPIVLRPTSINRARYTSNTSGGLH